MLPTFKDMPIQAEPKTEWRSIYIASALSFVGSSQFSIYFSSLWPYLQLLVNDGHATQNNFGFIIALYSLGQIISAPLFGYWSNKIKKVKPPLYMGLFLMFMGNIVYALLELTEDGSWFDAIYLMMVGRFITGMGSANSALLRTYASTASTVKDRPKAIALVTCGQAIGNTAGPALQLLFTPIGYPGLQIVSKLHLSMYTAPAYFACAMNFFGVLALFFLFKEKYAGIIEKEKGETKTDNTPIKLPPYDMIAVFVCYVTRFTQMFVNTNLETLGTPIAMMMYDWKQTTAVTNTSIAQGVLGGLTFFTYVIYIMSRAERYMHHFRIGCILALFVFLSFHVITFSWPFWPHVALRDLAMQKELTSDGIEPAPLKPMLSMLTTRPCALVKQTYSSLHDKEVGCNTDLYDWCTSLTQVNVWVYYITYVITIGYGFPSVNITMSTLFSRIIGPRRQGTQQGLLQMSGSVARMLGPILISFLYTKYGPRIAWMMEGGVILFTVSLWVIFYRRMVPLKITNTTNGPIKNTEEDEDSNESHTEPQAIPRLDLLPDDLKFIFARSR